MEKKFYYNSIYNKYKYAKLRNSPMQRHILHLIFEKPIIYCLQETQNNKVENKIMENIC